MALSAAPHRSYGESRFAAPHSLSRSATSSSASASNRLPPFGEAPDLPAAAGPESARRWRRREANARGRTGLASRMVTRRDVKVPFQNSSTRPHALCLNAAGSQVVAEAWAAASTPR